MIRIRITTEIIVIALRLLGLAKRMHPKLFATFRVVLLAAIQGQDPWTHQPGDVEITDAV
jgi:hypothetical protein